MLIVCILAGICILGRYRSDILGAEMTQSYPETQNNVTAGQLSAGWQGSMAEDIISFRRPDRWRKAGRK